jgi:Sec-independent protein translocase protein TatA
MELLGIGPLELVLVIVLAVVIFSPKDLAAGGRAVGRFLNKLYRSESYRAMRQVSQELQTLPSRLAREAQLEDLQQLEKDIQAPILPPADATPADAPPVPAEGRESQPPASPDTQPSDTRGPQPPVYTTKSDEKPDSLTPPPPKV